MISEKHQNYGFLPLGEIVRHLFQRRIRIVDALHVDRNVCPVIIGDFLIRVYFFKNIPVTVFTIVIAHMVLDGSHICEQVVAFIHGILILLENVICQRVIRNPFAFLLKTFHIIRK